MTCTTLFALSGISYGQQDRPADPADPAAPIRPAGEERPADASGGSPSAEATRKRAEKIAREGEATTTQEDTKPLKEGIDAKLATPPTLEVVRQRAELEARVEKLISAAKIDLAADQKDETKRDNARKVLREEVLYGKDSSLGQKHKAMVMLGEDGTITSASYAFGAWFERNFDRIDVNIFQPKARIYFDDGSDDPGEVDLFRNGAIVPAVDVVEMRFLNYLSASRKTAAGFTLSGGIGAPATSADGAATGASSAPVLLGSVGFIIAHQLDEGDPKASNAIIGFEAGYTLGITTDEAFADSADTAFYAGFGVQIRF